MKVILLQDIKSLGKRGDVKDVADGYARNFLLAKKLAEIATESAIKRASTEKEKLSKKAEENLEKIQQLANSLEGRELFMKVKEKDGKLFGAISTKIIAKELKKEKIELDEKNIILPEAIKEIGEYEIKIALDHGIEARVKLIVESES